VITDHLEQKGLVRPRPVPDGTGPRLVPEVVGAVREPPLRPGGEGRLPPAFSSARQPTGPVRGSRAWFAGGVGGGAGQ
jgi:hypothetical protein